MNLSGSEPKAKIRRPNKADGTLTSDIPILANIVAKVFLGGERRFLEPLMRFARGDVGDHTVDPKSITDRNRQERDLAGRGQMARAFFTLQVTPIIGPTITSRSRAGCGRRVRIRRRPQAHWIILAASA